MSYFGVVSLFNGIAALLAGLYVLFKDRKNQLYVSFSGFAITVALWAIFYSIWQSQESKEPALFFMRLAMAPCYFIPFAFLTFVWTLLEFEGRKKYRIPCLVIPTFFFVFSFSELNVRDVSPKLYFPFWPDPGPLMHVYVGVFFAIVIYSFYLLFRAWFQSSGIRRWQVRWVTITTLLAWAGGSTNWFLWYNIQIAPFPNVFVGVFFVLLAYAVIRRHLFDIDTLADIVQEAKLSAIGMLAAGINHEIRNPLYVAKGFTESLLANRKEGVWDRLSPEEREKKLDETLEKIKDQIARAVEIMGRFAEFSKPRLGVPIPESVCLNELVDNVLSFVGHELDLEKIKVEKAIDPSTQIRIDRKHAEEIFLNLILNACQAMPRGGLLRISDARQNGRILVSISDTGEGIPHDKIKRIFVPFSSTKREKGSGLGLYIVKKLIDRSGTKIRVTSEIGKGTTFSLELPGLSNS